MATEYSIGVEQMVEQMVEKIPPEIDNKILDIDKEKESKEKENVANAPAPLKRFIKPSIEEIKAYCNERNNKVNAACLLIYLEKSRPSSDAICFQRGRYCQAYRFLRAAHICHHEIYGQQVKSSVHTLY